MELDQILDRLLAANVVTKDPDAGTLSIAAPFERFMVDSKRDLERAPDVAAHVRDALADDEFAPVVATIATDQLPTVARYLALHEHVGDLSHADAIRALLALDTLDRGPPLDDGAPASFLPVYGDQLPYLLAFFQTAAVYVWRYDCDPCEVMVETFDDLDPAAFEDIALFAVYGPDSADVLESRFDVRGAPATLFILNGAIDSRVYGAAALETLEHELAYIRETSSLA